MLMAGKIIYLYLDDNEKEVREGDVDLINKSSTRIDIKTDFPSSWKHRAAQILADLNSIDGLILDWELTNHSKKAIEEASHAEEIDYSAESLAEHIRITITQQAKKDIPIIICSADRNKAFTTFQLKEQTGKDLFDLAFIKKDLFVDKVSLIESQLYDLAFVYKQLNHPAHVNIEGILRIATDKLEHLDIRFVDRLKTMLETKTTHDIVQFLLREFIEKEGILINENVLAARLGIDQASSKESWVKLRDIIIAEGVVYSGVLSIGWLRFWAFELELWWQKQFPETDLRILGATTRVAKLNEKFGLQLASAERIKFCTSDEYWTICYGLNRPIDPIDGFRIGEDPSYPWQNWQYVSALAELEKTSTEWRINVLDREQYKQVKDLIIRKGND